MLLFVNNRLLCAPGCQMTHNASMNKALIEWTHSSLALETHEWGLLHHAHEGHPHQVRSLLSSWHVGWLRGCSGLLTWPR